MSAVGLLYSPVIVQANYPMDWASSWLVFFPLTLAVIVMVLIYPHKPEPRAKARPRWQRFTLLPLLRDRLQRSWVDPFRTAALMS